MKDPCLEKFTQEWKSTEILVERAVILYNWVHYIKLRYRGVGKLSEQIGPRLAYLEEHVAESTGKDFLKIQRVIADGRRTIADCGSKYGSGFRRKPTRGQRDRIAKAYPAIRLFPGEDLVTADNPLSDPDDDLCAGSMGNDAA